MKIVLVGYMGCGKSSVGSFIAKKMQIIHYDLDAEIEQFTQLSTSELFETKGEIYFRKVENQVLKVLLAKSESYILSLGGGTPCYYNNYELLQQNDVTSFYLKGSVATLVKRLSNETTKRPLLSKLNPAELTDFINKHLFDRSFYYHQVNFVINIDDKSVNEVALAIAEKLT